MTDPPPIGHNRPPTEEDEAGRYRFLLICRVIARAHSLGATYRTLAQLTGIPRSTLARWMPAIESFAREWSTDDMCQARYRRFVEEFSSDLRHLGQASATEARKSGVSETGFVPNGTNRKE